MCIFIYEVSFSYRHIVEFYYSIISVLLLLKFKRMVLYDRKLTSD